MARTEATGRLDALVELYQLTYQLSFAIGEAYDRELKAGK
jgi:hypothetical protein